MESLATDRKTVWNMHAPDVNACPWHRPCICQIELVKRSCWSFRPPEIASLPPFLSFPKTVFPRCPLVAEPLTYPSPAHIPVLYSRVLQTNFGRSHPKNSNWEGKIHASTWKFRFYVENKPQTLFDFRYPVPYGYPAPGRSFLHEFFLAFWSSTASPWKANFRSAAPACIMCVNPTNRMRGHDEARRREASVQRSRPEVGRSIYIYIYIYLYISWQRRRWPPNWGLAVARPNYTRSNSRWMGAVRITSLNPKFNRIHFGLPPSGINRMTGWYTMTYAHRIHSTASKPWHPAPVM